MRLETTPLIFFRIAGFPPFSDSSFEQIKKGDYSFKYAVWKNKSESVKDLIAKMLTVNPHKRFTIEQIFSHPWMEGQKKIEGEPVQIYSTEEV